jgi:hypothetical protein
MPGRGFLSMASACSGMSGRDQASGAGDRSSVLVSPVTLNTVSFCEVGHFRTRGEPLGVGPALQDGLGVGVALVGEFLDVVEEIEDQQGLLEASAAMAPTGRAGEQVDQRLDVVTAEHGAEQFGRLFLRNQRAALFALGDLARNSALTLAASSTPGWHTVGEQLDQVLLFTLRRILQQFDEFLWSAWRSAAAAEYQAQRARQHGHDRIPARRRPFSKV